MTRMATAIVLCLGGCGTDVLLGGGVDRNTSDGGDDHVDTPIEHEVSTLGGTYSLRIDATASMRLCHGALTGQEDAFNEITRASLGFVEGVVTVSAVHARAVDVLGPAIERGYHTPSLRLEKGGGPGVPENIWIGIEPYFGEGPIGTELAGFMLEAFEDSVDATGFSGRASGFFMDPFAEGQCGVGFGARFDR